MEKKADILIIVGTNRKNALSAQVAHYYAQLLEQKGVKTDVLNLIDLPDDFIVSALYENMGKNPAFNQLKAQVEAASKYVFIVPEYNGSFPGILKTFMDGLPFPSLFKNRKCSLVGLSQGPTGGRLAISHLTDIFHYLGMHVHPYSLALAFIKDSRLETVLANPRYVKMLDEQAEGIIQF